MPRAAKTAPPPPATRGRTPMTYEDYLEKPATGTQQRFADWLIGTVGYNPTSAKTKADAFLDGVRLAVGMRIAFQNSDESQAIVTERKATKNGSPAPAKRGGRPAKATPAKTAKATKAPAKKTTTAKAAPAKRVQAATATAPPAKKTAKSKSTTKAASAPPQAKPKKTAAKAAPPPPPPTEVVTDEDVPF